jgi:hypothetical protein
VDECKPLGAGAVRVFPGRTGACAGAGTLGVPIHYYRVLTCRVLAPAVPAAGELVVGFRV